MIKEIQEENFTPFFELMAEIECGKHFDFSNQNHNEWLKKKISSYYYRGAKFFGFYFDNGEPIGFAALLMEEGPEGVICFGHKCDLLDIGILKKYRRKGFGSELLEYVEQRAKNEGFYCMYMSTYAMDYEAISFYGKNGFVPVATLPDINGPNDEGNIYIRKILKE